MRYRLRIWHILVLLLLGIAAIGLLCSLHALLMSLVAVVLLGVSGYVVYASHRISMAKCEAWDHEEDWSGGMDSSQIARELAILDFRISELEQG